MDHGMAGEDASLDASVAAIAEKLRGSAAPAADVRENRNDRDATEQDDYTDLEDLERLDREQRAQAKEQPQKTADAKPAESEGKEGADAEADEESYIELPPAEEGAEPERISAKDAAEAFKQLRQMNGDIAQHVIRAQDEADTKAQTAITQQLQRLDEIVKWSDLALKAMPLPRPPAREYLDPNSQHYNPETYHRLMIDYNDSMAIIKQVQDNAKAAGDRQTEIQREAASEYVKREDERVARYIPEWKDEKSRDAYRAAMSENLAKHYGITAEEMNGLPFSHKFLRLAADALKAKEAPVKQAEVKKQIQEKVPRVVRGQSQQSRDVNTGRFVSEARNELRQTGSEDAFARLLMSSGALKGL